MTHDDTSPATPSESRCAPVSAFFSAGAQLRLWVVALAALAFDLWSKTWAFKNLGPYEVREFIPSVLSFRRSVNPGALFGMGKGMVPVFIGASIVALGFVLYLFACSAPNRRSLHLALGFVLAGSLGNLHDRVFVIVDRVAIPGQRPILCKIIENDESSAYIWIGEAPDGAAPKLIRREGAEITRVGVVRDFLKIDPQVRGHDIWPWVFNVADSLLVIGVGVLMINLWTERRGVSREMGSTSAGVS